jgi:malonyl-CoA/methylmalonyl-CoA synthetase
MNLANQIKLDIEKYPDKRLLFDDQVITYGQLWDSAARVRQGLHDLGVQPGDRVAIQLPKCLEFLYAHLANLQLGSITIPLNPAYTREEIAYFLADSRAKVFVTEASHADFALPESPEFPELKHVVITDSNTGPVSFDSLLTAQPDRTACPAQSNDTALIIYTSGTTGRSKGAMLSQANLLATISTLHDIWGHSDQDVLLHVLPIFHVHGLIFAFHGALNAGMEMIIHTKFDPVTTLAAIDKYHCTVFMGVPTMYHRLLQIPNPKEYNLSSMRLWISGSAPLSAATFEHFQQIFGQAVLERYGMSETGINTSNPLNGERKPGGVGLPLPGVAMRIVDPAGKDVNPGEVGEVLVKGKNVFQGYWQMPDKTAESFIDEWFKTGDLGYQDSDGYLFLVGRSKDLIISGGMNVYPKEIEALLETNPAVLEAAVIGVPDDDLGERVVAVVVPKPGQTIDLTALTALCQAKLAGYKRPKSIYEIEALPRNTMGKVMKSQLRSKYEV